MEVGNVDNSKAITLIEWCAGYAGIGLGLKRVFGKRLRTIAYSELEGYAQANLISKMEQGLLAQAPIWSDIKTFPCEEFYGLVDIFSAGYPCQPFSLAGERGGADDPRHLWPFIQRAIRIIQPRFCFFENVRGHLTLGFKDVCHDLAELGYTVVAGLFTAAECGAEHKRERLYILAHSQHGRLERGRLPGMDGEMCGTNIYAPAATSIPICKGIWEDSPERILGIPYDRKNRVERLRLCGNAVIPETAELAFRTLYAELF